VDESAWVIKDSSQSGTLQVKSPHFCNNWLPGFFLGGLSLSQYNKVGGGESLTFCHKFVTLDPNNKHLMTIINNI